MELAFLTIFLVFSVSKVHCGSGTQYELLHNLKTNGDFKVRGKLTVLSDNTVKLTQVPPTDADISALNALSEKRTTPYRLCLCRPGNFIADKTCPCTFIDPCRIQAAELEDELSVTLNRHGYIVGFNVYAPKGGYRTDPSPLPLGDAYEFSTETSVQIPSSAPAPDTHTYLEKIKEEKRKKSKGETEDNRSFLAKYWMYIVPVFIILAMTSAQDQQGGGGE